MVVAIDGRVALFGASRQVLEMLDAVPWDDPTLRSRIEGLTRTDESSETTIS
jgi:hypothetical protein